MKLWEETAQSIASKVQVRAITATEAVQSSLDRLADVNSSLNAVVDRFDQEALEAAHKIDLKLEAGEEVGVLSGVPITVKVNVDQIGRATTNGVRLQKDLIAKTDNPVVKNLRNAGAVIIGRTNTPAFSLRWFTRNSLHGHTKNPVNEQITPGGSSGGAAASVAAGIGAIGHGTDIARSIRYPAYACGVHGLRPTLGRVPAYNASAQDRFIGAQLTAVSGPIARSIGDLRIALKAMSPVDARDPWSINMPLEGVSVPRKVAVCASPDGLNPDPQITEEILRAADKLEAAGWAVANVDLPPLRTAMDNQLMLWMAEMHQGASALVALEKDPDASLVYDRISARCPQYSVDNLMKVLQTRALLTRQWRVFLETYPLVLCPVSGQLPFDDLKDLESQLDFDAIIEAQMLQIGLPFMGLPCLSVATGYSSDRPVGVQLVAGPFREDILLAAGDIIGQTIPVVTPKF